MGFKTFGVIGLALAGVVVAAIVMRGEWMPGGARASHTIPSPALDGLERQVAERIAQARTAVEDDPRSAAAWGRLGMLLDAHDLLADAEPAYRAARDLDPNDVRWAYHLAHVSGVLERDRVDVLALWAQAERLGPHYAAIPCRLGDLLARWDRHEDASAAYRRALAIDPRYAPAHRGLGHSLLATGDAAGASISLERASALVPADSIALSALAAAYGRLGDLERAERAASQSRERIRVEEMPDRLRAEVAALGLSSPLCIARAQRLELAGRFEEALPDLRTAAEALPTDALIQLRLASALMRTGRADEARTHLDRAVALDESLTDAHVELGRVLMAQGALDEARRHLERAVALSPESAFAHSKFGTLLVSLGRPQEALAEFERSASLSPPDAETLVNWAVALAAAGDLDGAVERAVEGALRDPNYARAHHAAGYYERQRGREADAVPHLQDALALDPSLASAQGDLDAALAAAGDSAQRLSPRAEFDRIADYLYDSDQKYLGHRPAQRLALEAADAGRPLLERIDLLSKLARERLEIAETSGAVEAIESAFTLLREAERAPEPALHRLRALVYLRLAEVRNCIVRHNAECCIFPLDGGGVHAERGPADAAWESLTVYLRERPQSLGARWLLNVVAMALGEWPERVPAEVLIPPEAFASHGAAPRFRDVAPALGVHRSSNAGGVVTDDFDGDGLIDIVASGYDPRESLVLFVNDGRGGFVDRTESSGLDAQLGGLNVIGADYDNDGDVDLYVLRGAWLLDDGRIRKSLLRNDGGGVFTDVTREAGLARPSYPTQSAAWGDFDGDGDLDLYVGNESRVEIENGAGDFPAQLFVNEGGRFRDVAREAGITNDRYCKAVAAGDYDDDRDLDLYVSNSGPNRLYRNDGNLRFTDVAIEAGVVEPSGRSFACWFFDYDNDGRLDIWVGAFDATIDDICAEKLGQPSRASAPRLYRNRGDGTFEDATAALGLAHPYLPMGANFGDIDNDGWLDIHLGTGDPEYETLMPNVMLRNDEGKRFLDVTTATGLGHLQKGHGVAFADLDSDGDQDIYHQLGGFYPGDKFHNVLFENPGPGARFLVIELEGTRSNRMGYGARVRVDVETPRGPRSIHRAPGSVSSFGGSPARQEIGLGDATRIARVEVWWPVSGVRQTFDDVPLDAMIRIREGSDRLERLPYSAVRFVGS